MGILFSRPSVCPSIRYISDSEREISNKHCLLTLFFFVFVFFHEKVAGSHQKCLT